MYEQSLLEAAQYLATQRLGVIPAKDVWEAVVRKSREERFDVPSLADFTTMLEADKRFEFIPANKDLDEVESELDEKGGAEEELVQLGFFTEDQVRLKRVQPSRRTGEDDEEIGSIRRKSIGATKPVGRTYSGHRSKAHPPTTRRHPPRRSREHTREKTIAAARTRHRRTGAKKK